MSSMTSNSSVLLERAREFLANGAALDERVDTLILRGTLSSAEAQSAWLSFARDVPAPFGSVQVYNPDVSGDLAESDEFDSERRVQVTIAKPTVADVAAFMFQTGVETYLSSRTVQPRLLVADLKPDQAFRARGLDVAQWNLDEPIASEAPPGNPVDPSRYVRDFVPTREVATDLSPWILTAAPVTSSTTFAAWEALAARRLLAGLVSRTFVEDGRVVLQAAGPPVFNVYADSTELPSVRPELTVAAHWVFLSGIDIEARHVLFSAEMARASRPAHALSTLVAQALEGAKAAYEAHIQSSSRETLKVLADLRKTVVEETQKVTQKAQELTSTLWRDLAVFAVPLTVKYLGDAGQGSSALLSAGLCVGAAVFISLSFIVQWRTNNAFFESQQTSRRSWMRTLFSYISAVEREAIADAPIETAMRSYRETRSILLVAYIILVLILLGASLSTLWTLYGPPIAMPSQP